MKGIISRGEACFILYVFGGCHYYTLGSRTRCRPRRHHLTLFSIIMYHRCLQSLDLVGNV